MSARRVAPAGFPCPACGQPTRVHETRRIEGGLRRRRHCGTPGCSARITTAELAVGQNWATGTRTRGPVVAIRRRDLQNIASIVNNGLAGARDEEP